MAGEQKVINDFDQLMAETREQNQKIRAAALEYAQMGLRVFPINKEKHSVIPDWTNTASRDENQIKEWWDRWNNINVAILTGDASQIVVIDLDVDEEKDEDGREILRTWESENGKLPETWTDVTGRGGSHLIYRTTEKYCNYHNTQDKQKDNGTPLGVDIRGNGGCIVAVPSIHENGNEYYWDISPEDQPIAEVNEIVDKFIKWVYAHATEKSKSGKTSKNGKIKKFALPDKMPDGTRTGTLIRLIGKLRSVQMCDEAIRAAVEIENQRCVPPFTPNELEKTIFTALERDWEVNKPYWEDGKSQNVMDMLDGKTTYDKEGNVTGFTPYQTVRNFEIVLDNDPRFAGKICFDEFSQQIYLKGTVPWEETENNYRVWDDRDDSALFSLIQSDYWLNKRTDYYDAVKNVSMRHRFHPVRDMLNSFTWDGQEHIRGLLPDYLGADDSEYNYQVMRLWMLGAVARIYHPGCKFDYTMIFHGKQGIGKSTFLRLMALNDEWFSDSLQTLDSDKAAQSLSGSWIIEFGELKALSRTMGGVDAVKSFLSAQQDKYRIPYERRSGVFLRQCVFSGSTNRNDFLQDETGNRRFLIIEAGVNEPKKNLFSPIVMDDIKAAWAQAVHIWKTEKPKLILPKQCADDAKQLQNDYMADDGTRGIIEGYLADKHSTCALQIWREALGEQGRPEKWRTGEINAIIESLSGWEKMKNTSTFGRYGKQRGFRRVTKGNKVNNANRNIAENVDQNAIDGSGFLPVGGDDELPFD